MHDTLHTATRTFDEFEYQRPDMAVFEQTFNTKLAAFQQADNAEDQSKILAQINELREDFSSMYNLCYIRHTANTADAFYEQENDFFDTI